MVNNAVANTSSATNNGTATNRVRKSNNRSGNRNYRNNNTKTIGNTKGFIEEYRSFILPSVQELDEYEKHFAGSAQKILDMGKVEQRHRHQIQDKYAQAYNFTYRMGQIFGLIYSSLTIIIIAFLVISNRDRFALILLSFNAGLAALAIITTATTRNRQRRFNRHINLRIRNRH